MGNNMMFEPSQHETSTFFHNSGSIDHVKSYQDDPMFDAEAENEPIYENDDEDLPRKEYWQEYELDFTPNIVTWMKSNYVQHIKGQQHTVLVGGYNHCNEYFLQTLNYGKSGSQSIEIIPDDKITLFSEISDIQFADDQTAVVVTRNGQIQLIKLQQNDEYSPTMHQHDDEEKMMKIESIENKQNGNKWKLIPISSTKNPIICYPNPNNKQFHGVLTSVTVNTICGNIVASDECGYIYITDIDQQKSINSQSCSSSAINCIRFANSDQIASATMSGQLMLWDLRDLNKPCHATTLPRKHGSLMSLAVHPHRNNLFATGTEYGSIAIWDIRGTNTKKINGDDSYKLFSGHCKHTLVNDIKFLTNNSNSMNGLVTCGNDGITQIFQSEKDVEWKDVSQSAWNANITTIQEEKYPVTSLDFYEQLGIVVTCCNAQKLSFCPI